MIKRLVLYSLIFCSSGFSLNAQQESGSSYQTVAKKMRAFFKKKKGKVFIAVAIVLLGGSAVWYLRDLPLGTKGQKDEEHPFVAQVRNLWEQTFTVDVSVEFSGNVLKITTTKEVDDISKIYTEQKYFSFLNALREKVKMQRFFGSVRFVFWYKSRGKLFKLVECGLKKQGVS